MSAGGTTALYHACSNGHTECARRLLAVDGMQVDDDVDDDIETALFGAANSGHADTLSLLLQRPSLDVNARLNHKCTPLMVASFMGKLECARQLLAVDGINLDARDDNGDTALAYAAGGGQPTIMTLLIERGANVNTTNANGATVLQCASNSDNVECVRLLLNLVDSEVVNKVTSYGSTASEFGRRELNRLIFIKMQSRFFKFIYN